MVEDDLALSAGLCFELDNNGYITVAAYNCRKARQLIAEDRFDLVLLDVNLPDGEGFAFCRRVRERANVPVIFLTARDLEEDALTGYDAGAEDYVTKPFSMKVLLKKISVILKRTADHESSVFDDGYLFIDLDRARISAGGKECSLTPTELRLLKEFVTNKGQLLTYSVLLERLWDSGGQFVDKHALAVNINRLRRKIENEEHRYISNVYGMGYQWIG